MESVLDKLKKAAKAKKDAISKANIDNTGEKPYSIGNLTDTDYLLGKLPKGSLMEGMVDEDGRIDPAGFEKGLQRLFFKATQVATKENHDSIVAMREELRGDIEQSAKAVDVGIQEKDLKFYPDDELKNMLASTTYRDLKTEYPDASVEDLRAATLEKLKDIKGSVVPKEEEEEEDVVSDFSDLLSDLPEEPDASPTPTESSTKEPSTEE